MPEPLDRATLDRLDRAKRDAEGRYFQAINEVARCRQALTEAQRIKKRAKAEFEQARLVSLEAFESVYGTWDAPKRPDWEARP